MKLPEENCEPCTFLVEGRVVSSVQSEWAYETCTMKNVKYYYATAPNGDKKPVTEEVYNQFYGFLRTQGISLMVYRYRVGEWYTQRYQTESEAKWKRQLSKVIQWFL